MDKDPWDTCLQGLLMTQGKIHAEIVRKMILEPRQVVGYWSGTLLDAELPQPDYLLAAHPGVLFACSHNTSW